MSKRRFIKEQIEELSRSKFVKKCSEKSVTYSTEFKLLAIKRYEEEGLVPNQIFVEAGINPTVIGKGIPDSRVSIWRQIVKTRRH